MSDPLHGITLKALLTDLIDRHGFEGLAERVPIRCFQHEPSLSSSLKFLRKTPWARAKVERLYLSDQRELQRKQARNQRRAARRAFAASMPVERDETLAFYWPADTPAPPVSLPEGTRLQHGVDRAAFVAVQEAIGFTVTDGIWEALELVPDAMVFAVDDDGPVAVAAAEARPEGWVELGWVAVAPSERARGLGRAVCAALVAHLLHTGHTQIFGSTQDSRMHALRIYLGLGFSPVERPEKQDRWAAVLKAYAAR